MTRREKKKLQAEFLKKAGPNAATFKTMMDILPDVAFYIKDTDGRIMARATSIPRREDFLW